MPGLVWPVQDSSSHAVSFLFWMIEIFIMPLFLVLAGYFAYLNRIAGGDGALIRSRCRRLLVPMAVAAVVLLPIEYYLWIVGWVADGVLSPEALSRPKVPREMRTHLFGLGHLWFLHYVFFYCVALSVTGMVWRRLAPTEPIGPAGLRIAGHGDETGPSPFMATRWSASGRQAVWAAVVGLPLLGVMVLAVAPQVVYGFQHAFLPVASKWLYSGTFFFGGVVIGAVDPKWRFSVDSAGRLASFGAVCSVAAVSFGQWTIARSDATSMAMDVGWFHRLVLASLTVAAAWCVSLGAIGWADRLGRRFQGRRRFGRAVSYLAAASFWVYLVHHPLIAILHIDLKWSLPALSPMVKSMVTLGVAMAVSLLSYEALIRGSRLGRWIGVEPDVRRSGRAASSGGGGDAVRQEESPHVIRPTDGETVRRAA
jgi:peptidoglycan/LPS O-acetylase OafA/YrhL